MKKRKILMIGDTPPPYTGSNVLLQQLLNSDFKQHFDVTLLDISDRRSNELRGRFDLTNILLGLHHSMLLLFEIIVYRPQVVYMTIAQGLWGFVRDAVFINIAWLLRRKIVVHFHGEGFCKFYQRSSLPMKLLIKFSLGHIAILIVLAERLKPVFSGLVATEKMRVVYNGIDIKPFDAVDCGSKIDNGIVKVLYFSKKSKAKGVHDFLKSVPLVISKRQNVKFIISGDPIAAEEFPWFSGKVAETEKEINEFVRKSNLSEFVEFKGILDGEEKIRLFKESDIFVMPSYTEGMPIVVLEAMAAGLPVVATSVGALPEVIKDGGNGFIVEVGNYQNLADRILQLVENFNLRKKIGYENMKVVREKFNCKRYIEGIERVLKEV